MSNLKQELERINNNKTINNHYLAIEILKNYKEYQTRIQQIKYGRISFIIGAFKFVLSMPPIYDYKLEYTHLEFIGKNTVKLDKNNSLKLTDIIDNILEISISELWKS